MTISKSLSARQALNLQIEPSPFNDSAISLVSSFEGSSGSASSTSTSHTSGGPSSSESVGGSRATLICTVLCVHDFSSDEEHALSFRRNELLEVLKQEDTGWWAAMRRGTTTVGWIPEAYVKALTREMAETLRRITPELRVYEYQAELLYNTAPPNRQGLLDSDLHRSLPPAYRPTPTTPVSPLSRLLILVFPFLTHFGRLRVRDRRHPETYPYLVHDRGMLFLGVLREKAPRAH